MGMKRTVNEVLGLRTIAELEATAKAEMEEAIQRARDEYERAVQTIGDTYQIAADLDAAGIPIDLGRWSSMETLRIDLGLRPDPRRQRRAYREWVSTLATCKRILGVMKDAGRDLYDAKKRLVQQHLRPEAHPQVTLTYRRRLERDSKCKIVRKRGSGYSALVCER